MLKSSEENPETILLMAKVQQVCGKGGFNLNNFFSKPLQLLNRCMCKKELGHSKYWNCSKNFERALGVMWSVENDTFGFQISFHEEKPLSRRSSALFTHPCGLASPFLLKGSKILQEITSDEE